MLDEFETLFEKLESAIKVNDIEQALQVDTCIKRLIFQELEKYRDERDFNSFQTILDKYQKLTLNVEALKLEIANKLAQFKKNKKDLQKYNVE